MTTTYATLNPIGSTSPKDLSDNASNFDEFSVSPAPSFNDRFGTRRQTIAGAEKAIQDFIASSGFEPTHLVYTDGSPLTVNRPTQLVDRGGLSYRINTPQVFPVQLTGNWSQDSSKFTQIVSLSGLNKFVSVSDFKLPGDADHVAIQKAVDYLATVGGGQLWFEPRDYQMGSFSVQLPAVNLKLLGPGASARLFGTGDMIVYPASVRDGSGEVVTQDIEGLSFTQTGSASCIKMHQTWDGAGKKGPSVRDCLFHLTNASTNAASCISAKGLWAAQVQDCRMVGVTNGVRYLGSGFKVELDSNMNSSVMNVLFQNTQTVGIGQPFYMPPRVGAGRVEGIKITGCNFVAGWCGVTSNQCLAIAITGNQISDFIKCIESTGDFDVTISGNSELTAASSVIHILASNTSIAERYSITGNNIASFQNDVALIRITNTAGDNFARNMTIAGNTLRAAVGGTAHGVSVEGSFACNNIAIGVNNLSNVAVAFWFSGLLHRGINVGINTFDEGVGARFFDPLNVIARNDDSWSASVVQTLPGGTPGGSVAIAVPSGMFAARPLSATLSSVTDFINGYYDYDASTTTSLVFQVRTATGANIQAGPHRFAVTAFGTR